MDAVVSLAVPEESLITRALARGREDDREEVARERLRVYREQTEPLVEHYRALGLLREVDGSAPIERVTSRILDAVAAGRTV